MDQIRKAAVIGAGVMGAGIAAQFANAGCPVTLLDIPADGPDRSRRARDAIALQVKAGGFMHPDRAALVTPGNTDDHLSALTDADWVVEAVVERAEIKRDLYRRLDAVLSPGAVLSSNTSTIPLAHLVEGLPAPRARRLVISHFFNPPRHMRLLEIVGGPHTDAAALDLVADFADRSLGKSVVRCKDTPGFLANRIGCLWMLTAIRYAIELGLTVEEADAVIGKPFGIPPTGIFGLTDLVGLDLMPKVWDSFATTLPPADRFHAEYRPLPAVAALVESGRIGRKAKAGFYRKGVAGMEAVDWAGLDYRPLRPLALDSLSAGDARRLMEHDDRGGRYAWAVMSRTLAYAAELVPEISDGVAAIDEAMRLGYNWKQGPFQIIDAIGAGWLAQRLRRDGLAVPPLLDQAADGGGFYRQQGGDILALGVDGHQPLRRPPGVFAIADLRRVGRPLRTSAAASLWDMGDGVAGLEFHRKMNALAPESLDAVETAITTVAAGFRALVIGNDAAAFCAGADLSVFLAALDRGDHAFLDDFVRRGQNAFDSLLRAPFPVVGAVAGLALGGGCEILLHCDAVQAHAETAMGLVERNVGLIPAWGGCRRLLVRNAANPTLAKGPMPGVAAAFDVVAGAAVSGSALLARDLGFLGAGDGVTMNRDRLLADAKAKALALADGYAPPPPVELRLPGPSGAHTLMNRAETLVPLGRLGGHDLTVAAALAEVLTGGATDCARPLPETEISRLEREAFTRLCRHPLSRERIAHMLKTGKPLRN